jgi:hypothetical protein
MGTNGPNARWEPSTAAFSGRCYAILTGLNEASVIEIIISNTTDSDECKRMLL